MSLARGVGRCLRDIDLVIPGLLERALLRSRIPPSGEKIALPLLVVVGPPRVGSTLLSQLLASRYRFFFFTNFQHALLRYPYLSFKLSRRFIPDRKVDFRSDHGFEAGFGGLSEGIFFWAFWFDMSVEQKNPQPDDTRLQHARSVLNCIHHETGNPLLTAANTLSFYLTELSRHFEQLVIVNLRRDPVANAVSLLRGRRRHCTDVSQWWSIRPAACAPSNDVDVHHQIVCQIVETYRAIHKQRAELPALPIVDIYYEELCSSPLDTLSRIEKVCLDASMSLVPYPVPFSPPQLSPRGPRHDEKSDAQRFQELCSQVRWDELWF
jgi:hypothetical protein